MLEAEKILEAVGQLLKVLGPLESEDRHRVIQASLVMLKEKPADAASGNVGNSEEVAQVGELPGRARLWAKQNALAFEQLEHVFDFSDGAVTVIAPEVGGKTNSEKTIKAYVLAGVAALLSSGEPAFEDKAARVLCENFGCYDSTNHSKYMKDKGNNFTGSKDSGWKLTAPGLKYGAGLVKELSAT
jgi:hypothetical protein